MLSLSDVHVKINEHHVTTVWVTLLYLTTYGVPLYTKKSLIDDVNRNDNLISLFGKSWVKPNQLLKPKSNQRWWRCVSTLDIFMMTSSNVSLFRVTGPVNSSHKGQWRGALMFSLICAWINSWVNNREASDLRRNRARYNVTVMLHLYGGHLLWP